MKLYEKIINGKQHCKPENKIATIWKGLHFNEWTVKNDGDE